MSDTIMYIDENGITQTIIGTLISSGNQVTHTTDGGATYGNIPQPLYVGVDTNQLLLEMAQDIIDLKEELEKLKTK